MYTGDLAHFLKLFRILLCHLHHYTSSPGPSTCTLRVVTMDICLHISRYSSAWGILCAWSIPSNDNDHAVYIVFFAKHLYSCVFWVFESVHIISNSDLANRSYACFVSLLFCRMRNTVMSSELQNKWLLYSWSQISDSEMVNWKKIAAHVV